MSRAKYIVVQVNSNSMPYAVTFPPWEQHVDMARRCIGEYRVIKECIVGAGEFQVYTDKDGELNVCCFGKSTSLQIESRADIDARILEASIFGQN